jgi:hypothetical protein
MTLSMPDSETAAAMTLGPLLPIVLRNLGALHVFWNCLSHCFLMQLPIDFLSQLISPRSPVNTNTNIHCHDPPG